MRLRTVALSLLLMLVAAACGGSDVETTTEASVSAEDPATSVAANDAADGATTEDAVAEDPPADDPADDIADGAQDLADDLVEDLEATQAAEGGGSATLTVGDQTWTYSPVLCAFGEEEIGQTGAEFVLSALQDGNQMYFSIDQFGHSASLNDVQDFENPSVSFNSYGTENQIVLDGKNFSGTADFRDETNDSFETIPGTFSGTCP